MHHELVLIDQSQLRQRQRESHASHEQSVSRLPLELLNGLAKIPPHELRVPIDPLQGARYDVLLCRVDRPGEGFHPIRSCFRRRRRPPRRLHQFVSHPAEKEGVGLGDALDRVTMQVFVRDHLKMIAAPVQCDVDGIPQGPHFAIVPPAGTFGRKASRALRRRDLPRRSGPASQRHCQGCELHGCVVTAPPAACPSERGASCPSVLHERGNLHELDARANAVETGHALHKRIVKKSSGRGFGFPDVKVPGLTLCGIDREGLETQSRHSLKRRACRLRNLPHCLLIEIVPVVKRYEYADHYRTPSRCSRPARSAHTAGSGLMNNTHTKPKTSADSTPTGPHAFRPSATAPYRLRTSVSNQPTREPTRMARRAWVPGALRAIHEITMS